MARIKTDFFLQQIMAFLTQVNHLSKLMKTAHFSPEALPHIWMKHWIWTMEIVCVKMHLHLRSMDSGIVVHVIVKEETVLRALAHSEKTEISTTNSTWIEITTHRELRELMCVNLTLQTGAHKAIHEFQVVFQLLKCGVFNLDNRSSIIVIHNRNWSTNSPERSAASQLNHFGKWADVENYQTAYWYISDC